MKQVLFLVSGKAEVGKDTFFALAKELTHSKCCHRYAFGDEVKKVATEGFGWDGEKDEKGRALLQLIGDGARAYKPDIWIDRTKEKLLQFEEMTEIFGRRFLTEYLFITDCRYPNEIELMKKFAEEIETIVYSVRIERPNHVSKLTEKQLWNPSETALDDYAFDFVITNDGDLASYKAQVRDVLECLK